MYQTILFDLDGTLTESGIGIVNSVIYALQKYGMEVTDREELKRFIGPPLDKSFEQYCGFDSEKAKEAVEYYREYYREKGIFENIPYKGVAEMLKLLKDNGRTLIVATSKPEPFAKEILDYFKLSHYFDAIAGSNMDGTRTDKQEVIRYALTKAGDGGTASAIMVGDREHDIIGARAVGIDSLGVLYGYGSREELVKAGAIYLAENVEEAAAILLKK